MLAGVIHERRGEPPKAREPYEKVVALNARFAPAANNLAGISSEHGGDRDRALALAQTAKEQAPEDPQVSDTLGWILYRRGVHQRALALLMEHGDARAPEDRRGRQIDSYGRSGYLVCISQTGGRRMKASVKKKTYNLDSGMIDTVRRLFDAKTDTEAIQRALRKAIEDREVEDALDALLKEGRFRTLYR